MWKSRLLVVMCVSAGLSVGSVEAKAHHPSADHRHWSLPETYVEDLSEMDADHWVQEAQDAIRDRVGAIENARAARNVIMFLGDGMSVTTLAAARTLLGQRQGRTGEEERLAFETFPVTGMAKTYCVDSQIADSACTATAYLCGVKNNDATIGVTARVRRRDCPASADNATHVSSIAAWALQDGRDAGLVTTTRITHASPAGAFAHIANRDWENDGAILDDNQDPELCPDIAYQLVHHYPANQFKNYKRIFQVATYNFPQDRFMKPNILIALETMLTIMFDIEQLTNDARSSTGFTIDNPQYQRCTKRETLLIIILGGGRRNFVPQEASDPLGLRGRRRDGRNLIEEWQLDKETRNLKHSFVSNREELFEVDLEDTEYIMGLFSDNHLPYHMQSNETEDPTLAELTEVAIRRLSNNDKGYFLFVEGGRIDHAHHDNLVHLALDETIEFSKAVERARNLTSDRDTLILVTSDHSHVMAFNGYSPRGRDIIGSSADRDDQGVPYMTLSYANGPGFRPHVSHGVRPDVTIEANFGDLEWESHSDVELESETHGGEDVAVFALGPHQHMFTGLYEQSQLPHLMAYAACLGRGRHAPACNAAPAPAHTHLTRLTLAIAVLFTYFTIFQ